MDQPNNKIILIEGKQSEYPSFFFSLQKKGYDVEIARTGTAAVQKIKTNPIGIALLDTGSLHTNGIRIVKSLKKQNPALPVILIIDQEMSKKEASPDADVILQRPFTLKKLINRIKVAQMPINKDTLIGTGKIRLDVNENIVFVGEKSVSLTPKLTAILKTLIQHQNETVSRRELFKAAWESDFMADMRTLDVHIKWLRNAIEPDPKKPKYIKTIRGIGYSLVNTEEEPFEIL